MIDQVNTIELNDCETLAINLQRLMQARKISEAELARKTRIPQPTLHKILTGKTTDPRAFTLKSIADYFSTTSEHLLTGFIPLDNTDSRTKIQSIAVISWKECLDAKNYITTLTPTNWSNWIVCESLCKNAYGLISKPSMEPRFPKGTILIINPNITPVDGDIVVVHYPATEEATLRELSTDGPTQLLLPISQNSEHTILQSSIRMLGVLIKSTFSYHT